MLRNYQSDILKRTAEAFEHHRSVLVQMPTGTGKTVVLASFLSEERRGKREESKCHIPSTFGKECILIVAHRRELIEQIKETISRLGIDNRDIVVESIQTISRRIDSLAFTPSLVVIDEAHHALARTYRKMWKTWPEARFLGLTATPCRLNGKGFTDLFQVLITSHTIGKFIHDGWLSLFDYYSIKADSEDQRIINSLDKRGADGDYQAKELDKKLNCRPSIERLYESVKRYAEGKKGIVYAINIDHAHNIADYYKEHGINAVAIDSKTPAATRQQTVDEFKSGMIRVMVSVDLFSEGFDCPDVEFIQLARPTLSLAKYLQMVGRGLRKSEGKESCVMIDNVGLYRMFGLPAADRNWQAMFEGRMAGKGLAQKERIELSYAVNGNLGYTATIDTGLDEIINHEKLLEQLNSGSLPSVETADNQQIRAFKDRDCGLYGLKIGNKIVAMPQYQEILDIKNGSAAVRLEDRRTAIVSEDGNVITRMKRYASIKLQDNDIISAMFADGTREYVDTKNGFEYKHRPTVVKFGKVEMLKVGGLYYCRTKTPHRKGFNDRKCSFVNEGFYLEILIHDDAEWSKEFAECNKDNSWHSVTILATDNSDCFFNTRKLADGSIIVSDKLGNYYHVEEGKQKQYIGNTNSREEQRKLSEAKELLRERAEKTERIKREEKMEQQLKTLQEAEPFLIGTKWGLKLNGKIVVPPIYRTIMPAVGLYRAVETSPRQWGVILLNGKVIIEPKYEAVKLNADGSADVTIYKGKTMKMELTGGLVNE